VRDVSDATSSDIAMFVLKRDVKLQLIHSLSDAANNLNEVSARIKPRSLSESVYERQNVYVFARPLVRVCVCFTPTAGWQEGHPSLRKSLFQ